MTSDKVVCYDGAFVQRFEALGAMIDAGDRSALYRFLRRTFGDLFRLNQYYARTIAEGDARDFDEADEAIRRELMRPLSWRQYRMIEQAFLAQAAEDVICSIREFLYDNGRIYRKKAMSAAEVAGFSLILEQVYICLSHEAEAERKVRIGRVAEMEARLNRLAAWLEDGSGGDVSEDVRALDAYYRSPLWRADFEADEAGELPADLPRGVLSEDGIYDALAEFEARTRG